MFSSYSPHRSFLNLRGGRKEPVIGASSIKTDLSHFRSFRRSLLAWYRQNGRDLPWRRSRDPYAILVSEFMLQQTQVATVVPFYSEWMRRFPNFSALAVASDRSVLHAWQGLGYYARARNLHATARIVMEKHGGCFPDSPETIRNLPGIGRYTANAVATFAFNRPVPIVEANIARLLARFYTLEIPIDTRAGTEMLWQFATALLPKRNAGRYNSALMELGALVCRPRPNCAVCPVRKLCAADNPSTLPLKSARPSIKRRRERHSFYMKRDRVLLEQSQDRWRGLWILPRLARAPLKTKPIHTSEFPFTNHRVTLTVFPQTAIEPSPKSFQRWFPIDVLDSIPLPSPHRRALQNLILARAQRV